jgi:ankyrin repeat protein
MAGLRVGMAVTLLLAATGGAGAQEIPDSAIRAAATRGFAAIQAAQRVSRKTQSCAGTCHLQGYGSQAYRAAREHGLTLDEEVARADATRWFGLLASNLAGAVERTGLGEEAMTTAFALVSAHAVGLRPSLTTAVLARALALRQNPAGDWVAQATRPPSNTSSFMFTAVGLRALQLYAHPTQADDVARRVALARSWLESHGPEQTEDRAYQLLGLSWAGVRREQLLIRAGELLRTQQRDGGWTSLDGRPSDAYATGQALVALHDATGLSLADEAWRRGIAFLLRTQAADGTWHVRTRLPPWVSPPYYESGYPYGRDQFISVAGASWAVMALSRALGPAATPDALPLASLQAPQVEPWIETAIFGTVSDLQRLLDEGLSPNAVTAAGRVPILSLVVPDVEKVKLLVECGAAVNARSQARYSPLFVAAQYRQSTPVIRVLLDHGAQVNVPAGEGRPNANASAVFFAAHAGNAETLPALHKAGGPLDTQTIAIGNVGRTPLSVATLFNHLDAVRALLDLGIAVDQTDSRGRTALGSAVIGNRPEVVRLLLARGAAVNHMDDAGMTPLIYAAAIDFGHSTIVDMLLAAGARPDVRDKEGLTALERARRDGNTHVIPSLERAATAAAARP